MISAQEAYELTVSAHTKLLDGISKHIENRAKSAANYAKHCFKADEISMDIFNAICESLKEHGYVVEKRVTGESYQITIRW